MKIDRFDPPGNNDDFGSDAALKKKWSDTMSRNFDTGVSSVTAFLASHGGGTCQFYNPVTHGRSDPDLPLSAGEISWNGFPKRFLSPGPGVPTDFKGAERPIAAGENREQDEYLEWHVTRRSNKIVSVQFTCEGYDYYDFLAENARGKLVELYRKFIDPAVKEADLFKGDGSYDRFNRFNTADGAMHLTHGANNLFAEVFLAATATVRRKNAAGVEHTSAIPLIKCGKFGGEERNSDPKIGIEVNSLARQKRMIALANPVGLYIGKFDGSGFRLPDGSPAGGSEFFKIVRGTPGQALRAVYELPPAIAASGLTVSDVKIGGKPIEFGGQIAEKITMKLTGVASVAQGIDNAPVACGGVPPSDPPHFLAAVAPAAGHLPPRGA
jgi:hypothetical protein